MRAGEAGGRIGPHMDCTRSLSSFLPSTSNRGSAPTAAPARGERPNRERLRRIICRFPRLCARRLCAPSALSASLPTLAVPLPSLLAGVRVLHGEGRSLFDLNPIYNGLTFGRLVLFSIQKGG